LVVQVRQGALAKVGVRYPGRVEPSDAKGVERSRCRRDLLVVSVSGNGNVSNVVVGV
jgi:hypothetical protein